SFTGTGDGQATFAKVAVSGDGSTTPSVTVSGTASTAMVGEIFDYRGINTTQANTTCPGTACFIRQIGTVSNVSNVKTYTIPAITSIGTNQEVLNVGSAVATATFGSLGSYTI